MAAQGRDIKLSTARVEGYRNFATKLWNAARFSERNECVRQKDFGLKAVKETRQPLDRRRGGAKAAAVTAGIEAYKFDEAAAAIYKFAWGTFCDWYLEWPSRSSTARTASQGRTRATGAGCSTRS